MLEPDVKRPRIALKTGLAKKRAVGLVLLIGMLVPFLALNRFRKLDIVRDDLDSVSGATIECFQGFCIEIGSGASFVSRWIDFSITYLELVTIGMIFAFLVAGLTESFLFPRSGGAMFGRGGSLKRTLKGLAMGPVWNLCSACIAPISASFRRRGGGVDGAVAMVMGSSTLNIPALAMATIIFTPMLGGSRIVLGLVGGLLIGPLVAYAVGERNRVPAVEQEQPDLLEQAPSTWGEALTEGFRDWAKASLGYLVRMGPIMVAAGFASGLVIQWINPDTVSTYLGSHAMGIAIAATLGVLINVPLMFEIPLVALLLLLGMGTAPAATLLFAAAAAGPITFWALGRVIPRKGILTFAAATWMIALLGGMGVWAVESLISGPDTGLRTRVAAASSERELVPTARGHTISATREIESDTTAGSVKGAVNGAGTVEFRGPPTRYVPVIGGQDQVDGVSDPVTPFVNVAAEALLDGYKIWNDRPGIAVFDYDRDGDLDFYLTSQGGRPNRLYRNEGDGTFKDVAALAGVTETGSHSTGVVACDLNNDGFQDLYVGAWGDPSDRLDFRSPAEGQGNVDSLFINNGDGSFRDATESAFGDSVNIRSAASVACADVDGDGWLDIFVGNLGANDYRTFNSGSHPGHYNVLYLNNGDLTFTDVTDEAGVRGPQIVMRTTTGEPILYEDPETGELYEGWDPSVKDKLGNTVGEPTGQTHAVMFFDYDDDGDPDLWVANDGDRLHVYRNDSGPGLPRFTPVAQAMGIDRVGSWMGFAIGDYDGDADLDVFVANLGYHHRLRAPMVGPSGSCEYSERFVWGTCLHFLLRNDGTRDVPGVGTVGLFHDVAQAIVVKPSPYMPPLSLDPSTIDPGQEQMTGLAAYDFAFGSTFFDYENDGDADLYWLGSNISNGSGPGGEVFPSAGRMMRADGRGSFEDITVRARLLDIMGVRYDGIDDPDSIFSMKARKIDGRLHENGKGLAHGDLNGDGYVDLIGSNSSGPQWEGRQQTIQDIEGPLFVWMNGGGDNHWIKLRLRGRMAVDGTGSNADGIGARVYLKSASGTPGRSLVQVQEVRAGSSYLSMDSIELEFGLGSATSIDEIVIFWPSGREQSLKNVSADQSLLITEPAD